MSTKLGRNELPAGHTREDFECFGPVATRDTEFAGCKLADMGCFTQDGKDTNKYYFACIAKSKKDGKWYMYVEYGRTNDGVPDKPQFQFMACSSESEAMDEFADQCAVKNTKRGRWEKIGSKERYVPRVKKDGSTEDLYVVRYMASRAVGLPSAKNICNSDAIASNSSSAVTKTIKKTGRKVDLPTQKLFRDLIGGTISYTRSTMVGGTIPALSAINDAKDLLQDALARVGKIGNDVKSQVADAQLRQLTYTLYGMIPKVKARGAHESTWILSQENIGNWQNDLDAFETAAVSGSVDQVEDNDIMQGIPADVEWIDPNSEVGKWLMEWWGSTLGSGHGNKRLKVHNLWKIARHGDEKVFRENVEKASKDLSETWNNERPKYFEKQKQRADLNTSDRKLFWNSNVGLGYHGSRTTNVAGIIRENFRFPSELKKIGVVINGAMFGSATYIADTWSKSANYCSDPRSVWAGDGGIKGRHSFMFACDTIFGHPHVAPDAYGFSDAPQGHHSVLGKAGHTKSWANTFSNGTLLNNEWVIYRKGRILMRYLAEISW